MRDLLRYDHYKILGVERTATTQDIKRAYRQQVKRTHPDRNASPRAGELFQAIHNAYGILSDPDLRRRYDERLATYRAAHAERHSRPATGSRDHHERSSAQEDIQGPWAPAWAFFGLHLTGLLFGLLLVLGVLFLIVFREASWLLLVVTAPGWFLIPDCYEVLRFSTKAPN